MGAGDRRGEKPVNSFEWNMAKDSYVAHLLYPRSSPNLCLVLSANDAFNYARGVVLVRLAPTSV
jgi:hypothetical protein